MASVISPVRDQSNAIQEISQKRESPQRKKVDTGSNSYARTLLRLSLTTLVTYITPLLIRPSLMPQPSADMAPVGIQVCPMNDATFFIPFILAEELDCIAFFQG